MIILAVEVGVGGSWIAGVSVVDYFEFCAIYFLLTTKFSLLTTYYSIFRLFKAVTSFRNTFKGCLHGKVNMSKSV